MENMVLVAPLKSTGVFSAEGEARRAEKIKGAFPAEDEGEGKPRGEAAAAEVPTAEVPAAEPPAAASSKPTAAWVDSGEVGSLAAAERVPLQEPQSMSHSRFLSTISF